MRMVVNLTANESKRERSRGFICGHPRALVCVCVCVCVCGWQVHGCACVPCAMCNRYDNPLGRTFALFFTFSRQENSRKINVDSMISEYNQLHDDETAGVCISRTPSLYLCLSIFRRQLRGASYTPCLFLRAAARFANAAHSLTARQLVARVSWYV